MVTLYGFGPMRSTRVVWALRELGLPYTFVPVNVLTGETHSPEFLRLNPAGKIPVLVDGDMVLRESGAIVHYLADKFGEGGLNPDTAEDRAKSLQWTLFCVTELEQPLWRIARHSSIYSEADRLPHDIVLAKREFLSMAKVMEDHLDGGDFLVGARMSAADCVAAFTLDWADQAGLLGDFPNLKAYLVRLYERPTAPPRIAEAFAALADASSAPSLHN